MRLWIALPLCLAASLFVSSPSHSAVVKQVGGTGGSDGATAKTSATEKSSASAKSGKTDSKASEADIAAAKSSGKVWVNLDTNIYHKSGRWYGKTKSGKFMTEGDAKAAGYKAAHGG